MRHPDRVWVRASAPLPDDALVHACGLAYASDLGSGFGQTDVPGLATGGPSIDHAVWFHAPLRADEWMLLELAPRKARSSRGVYDGTLRNVEGQLGALIVQEMLLRELVLDDETLQRVADFLGVTPED
jgi:acyl-CoA thioesterase-2